MLGLVAPGQFERYEGAGLDGVVAKPLDLPYRPDVRLMYKIKHERTADVVVAGYRFHRSGPVVGPLLLGPYDDRGALQHVGVCAAFTAKRRAEPTIFPVLASVRHVISFTPVVPSRVLRVPPTDPAPPLRTRDTQGPCVLRPRRRAPYLRERRDGRSPGPSGPGRVRPRTPCGAGAPGAPRHRSRTGTTPAIRYVWR